MPMPDVSGVLLVDKPVGPTSFEVVQRVRRALGVRKAGHTGTLDPNASGLLPVCLGEATRIVPFLVAGTKSYRGTVRLGVVTDTLDSAGQVLQTRDPSGVSRASLEAALARLTGVQQQIAPMYSAKRVGGRRLYELARAGEAVEREAFEVTVDEARLEEFAPPDATIFVRCSKGTYIRSLAASLGETLGCGAHLAALRRLSSGTLDIESATSLEAIEREPAAAKPLSIDDALTHLPALQLDERQAISVSFGNGLTPEDHARLQLPSLAAGALARLVDPAGQVVAVGESNGERSVRLVRVLRGRVGPGTHRRA